MSAAKHDADIDELYRQPLGEFVAARNALAKTMGGADAAQIRKLPKPTVVPWAVNQVYWHARPVYDRLLKAGERLRKAQIAALEGRSPDVRAASEAHRRAIADAVQEAERLARATGSQPAPDALMRTFETLSLAAEPPEAPGRLTQPLQPAGFEVLRGVPLSAGNAGAEPRVGPSRARGTGRTHGSAPPAGKSGEREGAAPRRTGKADRQREREEAAAARRKAAAEKTREAEVRKADAAVERAKAAESMARDAWERAKRQVHDAEATLKRARESET